MTNDLAQRIGELVAAGRTIDAIKELRAATGFGLAEAKDVIDALAAGRPLSAELSQRLAATAAAATAGGAEELPADVRAAATRGHRIEAIKLLRGQRGLGLKEAKDLLDRAMPVPAGAAKRGCLLPLLFGVVVGAVACSALA